MEPIVAWHFTDPGCPWAYSSRPAIARLRWRFGDQLDWRLVLIGLSEDTERLQANGYTPTRLANTWPKFERRFGMPFGTGVKTRLHATSRACRAIIAVRETDPELGYAALRSIQVMQFATTRLLDDDEHLRAALAEVPGIDADAAVAAIDNPDVIAAYEADRARARSAEGGPTHVQGRHSNSDGPTRFTAPSVLFEQVDGCTLEVGGFQPFESYDTALANLAPTLRRRPAPAEAAEAVLELPLPLTTAEVASIMRPSDLEDADLTTTRAELTAAAGEGRIVCGPVGGDAVWRAPRPGEQAATEIPAEAPRAA